MITVRYASAHYKETACRDRRWTQYSCSCTGTAEGEEWVHLHFTCTCLHVVRLMPAQLDRIHALLSRTGLPCPGGRRPQCSRHVSIAHVQKVTILTPRRNDTAQMQGWRRDGEEVERLLPSSNRRSDSPLNRGFAFFCPV